MKIDIPHRSETIKAQKDAGGKIAAVFPIHYPRELFRAYGFLPVEVWGPPGVDDSRAGSHLQSYTCAIVRNGLSFLLSGGLDTADVVVVPNSCDSLQGLGSALLDFIKPKVPVLTLYPPRATRPSDRDYLAGELGILCEKLSKISEVQPTCEQLREAVAREAKADRFLAEIHQRRRELPLEDLELYRLIRSREYLPAEDFTELARQVLEQGDWAHKKEGVPLLFSGIVPEPRELFTALAGMNVVIVADDFAACGRRLYPEGVSDEPLMRASERLLDGPPDPMRGSSIQARIQHLRRLVRESGAKGVVFYNLKFCEPELFDMPLIREALKDNDIPSLLLEVDLSGELPGQVVTRLEAFVEMLG